jgi:hypothetical protein
MKTFILGFAAVLMLSACQPAVEQKAEDAPCEECLKMARDAKAAHDAKLAKEKAGADCECCKGGKHAH